MKYLIIIALATASCKNCYDCRTDITSTNLTTGQKIYDYEIDGRCDTHSEILTYELENSGQQTTSCCYIETVTRCNKN